MTRRWLYGAAGTLGTALLTTLGYLAADAWTQVGRVPTLEERLRLTTERLDGRLGRIEDSLDLLLRLQLRRVEASGTMVVCKDDRGRVAACQER